METVASGRGPLADDRAVLAASGLEEGRDTLGGSGLGAGRNDVLEAGLVGLIAGCVVAKSRFTDDSPVAPFLTPGAAVQGDGHRVFELRALALLPSLRDPGLVSDVKRTCLLVRC